MLPPPAIFSWVVLMRKISRERFVTSGMPSATITRPRVIVKSCVRSIGGHVILPAEIKVTACLAQWRTRDKHARPRVFASIREFFNGKWVSSDVAHCGETSHEGLLGADKSFNGHFAHITGIE